MTMISSHSSIKQKYNVITNIQVSTELSGLKIQSIIEGINAMINDIKLTEDFRKFFISFIIDTPFQKYFTIC